MTTLQTVLNGATTITTAVAPTTGNVNTYNASGGALSVTLPALSGVNVGANMIIEKTAADTTYNAVTFTCAGSDSFDDGSTVVAVNAPGENRWIQAILVGATKYWTVISGRDPKQGLVSNSSQVAVTNTTTSTTLITTSLKPAQLPAGATYRIRLGGTVQVQATSGTLTFTSAIQGVNLAQTAVMATQGSATTAGFWLESVITVRSTGSSGTAIASPYGQINFTTPVQLTSTSSSTTTINTTTSGNLSISAQWATASATNSLLVNTATIQRVV